jgi:O-antigen ligase
MSGTLRVEEQPAASVAPLTFKTAAILLAAHLALGLAVRFSSAAATLHAASVVLAALYVTSRSPHPDRMLLVAGYALGSCLLWRVGRANVLWFLPEYLALFIMLFGVWRFGGARRGDGTIIVFLALLLPSAGLTIFQASIPAMRKMLAFNLLPHVVMAVVVLMLSRLRITAETVRLFLYASVLPVISTWVLSAWNVFVIGTSFGTSSNDFAAGGTAANQVSNALSYGAVALGMVLLIPRPPRRLIWIVLPMLLLLAMQSVLTFSRGGSVNLALFLVFSMPFILRDRKQRIRFFFGMAIVTAVFGEFILPRVEMVTEGAIEKRFNKEGTSGRDDLFRQDLDMFLRNPLLGVGPGMGRRERFYGGDNTAQAHTEYSRILAEHGAFGAIALVVLLLTFYKMGRRAREPWQRGLVAGSVAWMFGMFGHSATRVPMFILLAAVAVMISFLEQEKSSPSLEPSDSPGT